MSGLVERDYVMRLVKQLAELLARALKLKAAKKHDEALEVLESGCLSLLGMDFRSLALVDSASAAELLKDAGRITAFAGLLEQMASTQLAAGDEAAGRSRRQHAFEMFAEALRRSPNHQDARAGLERLRPTVELALVPERYRRS